MQGCFPPRRNTPQALSRVLVVAALAVFATAVSGCRPHERPPATQPAAKAPAPRPAPGPQIGTTSFAHKRYTVCRVDLIRQRLELFWKDDAGTPFRGFEALDGWLRARGRQLVSATNAGMFREDFSPVGLYVERGKQLRPLNLSRGKGNFCLRPNGVFAVTRSGAAVVESSRYPGVRGGVLLATQSGPMLVINGRIHPAFSPHSTSRLIRNGVGVVSPQRVVFAISEEPVSFYEFATLFRDGLHCKNALFLDGSVSGLFSTALHRSDSLTEFGPIIGVTEPLQAAPKGQR